MCSGNRSTPSARASLGFKAWPVTERGCGEVSTAAPLWSASVAVFFVMQPQTGRTGIKYDPIDARSRVHGTVIVLRVGAFEWRTRRTTRLA